MVQADRLAPKVAGHLAPCCIHRVNQGELSQCFKHDDRTMKIILVAVPYVLCIVNICVLFCGFFPSKHTGKERIKGHRF